MTKTVTVSSYRLTQDELKEYLESAFEGQSIGEITVNIPHWPQGLSDTVHGSILRMRLKADSILPFRRMSLTSFNLGGRGQFLCGFAR
jgi:hypothetical protein